MSTPTALAEIIDDFEALGAKDKVALLLEFSQELPPLPPELEEAAMEPVPECQSPLFLRVDVSDPQSVRLTFSAPRESPTTRGFAGILYEGLDGCSAEQILAVPEDFYVTLGLGDVVSPLRLRGLSAMLHRVKRTVRDAA